MNLDEYIHFTHVKQGEEFQRLAPMCQKVAQVASLLAMALFNERLICTSIFRKKTTDSGIHEGYRAIDFAPLKTIENTYLLIRWINWIFTYDPERPLMRVAGENPYHGTGFHCHFQTHPNTTFQPKSVLVLLLAQASQDKANFKPLSLG